MWLPVGIQVPYPFPRRRVCSVTRKMNTPKHSTKTKTWSFLAGLLVLGSIAGFAAASGGVDSAMQFVGQGSGDVDSQTNVSGDIDANLRADVNTSLRANVDAQADLQ